MKIRNNTYLLLLYVFIMLPERKKIDFKLYFSSIKPYTATDNNFTTLSLFFFEFTHYDCSIVKKVT